MKLTKPQKRNIIEAVTIIIVLAGIFAVCFHLSDLSRYRADLLTAGACFGGFVGFAGLPYFNKKHQARPIACAVIAAMLGGSAALWMGLSGGVSALLVLGSALVGYFAPKWVEHIQF